MSEPSLPESVILSDVTPTEVNSTEWKEEKASEDVKAENCEIAVASGFLKIENLRMN